MKRVTGKLFTITLSLLLVLSLAPTGGIAYALDEDAAPVL